MYVVTHLNAVTEGRTTTNGSGDMDGLSHLLNVGALFKAGRAIGIDTIRHRALQPEGLRDYRLPFAIHKQDVYSQELGDCSL